MKLEDFNHKKVTLITSSYEECPYILWLDKYLDMNIIVLWNNDLFNHLQKINFSNAVNIYFFPIPKGKIYNLFFQKASVARFIKKNELITESDALFFFTRFAVPSVVKFINFFKLFGVQSYFVPISIFSKKEIKDDGISLAGKISIFSAKNILDYIYLIYYWMAYAGTIKIYRIGWTKVPTISSEFMSQNITTLNFFKDSDIQKYDEHYLNYNYFSNSLINKKKGKWLIFFDQDYEKRNLVFNNEYREMLINVFKCAKSRGYMCFYKLHPGSETKSIEYLNQYADMIPSFIPSEFAVHERSVSLSFSSGSIANDIRSRLSISLIKMTPYLKSDYGSIALEVLLRKTKRELIFPENQNDLLIIL